MKKLIACLVALAVSAPLVLAGAQVIEIKRVKNGRYYLIPASAETRGHGTTGMAKFWAKQMGEWLAGVPKRD